MEARLFSGALPGVAFLFSSPCNSVCQSGDKITKHSYEAAFVVGFSFFAVLLLALRLRRLIVLRLLNGALPLIASLKEQLSRFFIFSIHDGRESFPRTLRISWMFPDTCCPVQ